ncbi:bifunctional UDP-N-acetylmuramoyl-tripeptide:D-alanyl-D-alanine ligase/alanine racemase [Fulvitalea axinellae]|uniref:Alanine racemase n=1 Tax=Fulvitalea axinellae TaxID=1182444 RepID=A0AAU9C8M7_9BACT|nr:bifunctional UDP-N-acetylmuramoyl-tripeptide:D-alanyl-D-alanine ligase/alanine racemase [Fulvitalea axinellae]
MKTFDLPQITGGKYIRKTFDEDIKFLITDSRKPVLSPKALFFAIRGERHDGHRYLADLYAQGVRQFVVERQLSGTESEALPEANVLLVENSVDALQKIASRHRRGFEYPLVAVTGSNGKTIVKEWLAKLLGSETSVVRNPGSYNSQIGVPLSVWEMAEGFGYAVFEAGISKLGEMRKLWEILRPDIGIFTNIGPAHDEGFENRLHKIKEKIRLFEGCRKIVFRADQTEVRQALEQKFEPDTLLSWTTENDISADFRFRAEDSPSGSRIEARCGEADEFFAFPFRDEASVENILHVLALLLSEGFPVEKLRQGLVKLQPVSMRLELKKAVGRSYLIDDSYNNDRAGLRRALDLLVRIRQKKKKTLILSDMRESGLPPEKLYPEIADIVNGSGISRFIGIGEEIREFGMLFPADAVFFGSTEEFLRNTRSLNLKDEIILVKGAREMRFERIVRKLEEKAHGTRLEVNLDAITHNLNFYRSRLRPETKIMVMVKAFGYGNGGQEIADLLQYHRVDYLGVAYADEGVSLRQQGIRIPIMVMNTSEVDFENILEYDLEPEIYSFDILRDFSEFMENTDKKVKVHLKVDTGMRRLGFASDKGIELARTLKKTPALEVASVFSHLAGADGPEHVAFSARQVRELNGFYDDFCAVYGKRPMRHTLNSAGIVRFPEYQFDMVRLGIGLYGVEANGELQEHLRNVSSLKTVISQIRNIPAGESVGYSRKGRFERDGRIATVAIGYADGFRRVFGNGNARMLVNGRLAPTVGNICMDMCMIDITGIEAEVGDEVTVFGETPTVSRLADDASTIAYEILTDIGQRVKRVFITE